MEPKYLKAYEHEDCSGRLVFARSGPSINYEVLSTCIKGADTSIVPPQAREFALGAIFMEITRNYAIDLFIAQRCVVAGEMARGYLYGDCDRANPSFKAYSDANCTHQISLFDLESPHIRCFIPRPLEPTMPRSDSLRKSMKKYSNGDCTGDLESLVIFNGVLAGAQHAQMCSNGFELNPIEPTSGEYAHGANYLLVTYDMINLTVLEGKCIAYAPSKYAKVNCLELTIDFYHDNQCKVHEDTSNSSLFKNRKSISCEDPSRSSSIDSDITKNQSYQNKSIYFGTAITILCGIFWYIRWRKLNVNDPSSRRLINPSISS